MKENTNRQRTLTVKLELHPGEPTWKRLRELAWQGISYRNNFLRAWYCEAAGLRVDPEKGDPHDVTKHIRRFEKGELSGAAYSAMERECSGIVAREGKKILAGKKLSEWGENSPLSIRGHKKRNESGVRLTHEGGHFIAHLNAQAAKCEGGGWFKVRLADGVQVDDWQAPILRKMAAWEIPILKGQVKFVPLKGKALLQLSYSLDIPLPPMGERVATLGLSGDGVRLFLRTETQTIDYSHKLYQMKTRKDDWDAIRRRWKAQIGRRKGAARAKRRKLANISTGEWFKTFLHQWSREIADWCSTQGVGTIRVLPIGNLDWPLHQFMNYLAYKAAEYGISVSDEREASMGDASTKRAAKQEAGRERRKAKRTVDAVRTLRHEIPGAGKEVLI